MAKFTKTFKTVNYLETVGDSYARWSQGGKKPNDSMSLSVTDETGKEVYFNCIRKGGMLTPTLSCCKSALNDSFRVWSEV